MEQFDFTYLSLGAGIQSTALLAMSALGLRNCPKADCAIFADTQCEPHWVYEHLECLKIWSEERGIPVHVVTAGNLAEDAIGRHRGRRKRFASLPLWTTGRRGEPVPLRRQCTREYKIAPIEKRVRELLGYRKRQRVKKRVAALIGISRDESLRVKESRTTWITNFYPLIDANMRRANCLKLTEDVGLPKPQKSACVFCPYHDDRYWRTLKNDHPDEFDRAVSFDRQMRDMSASGVRNPVYLHRSCRPLEEIAFPDDAQLTLAFDGFLDECDGMCGL